jgi:cytoskeletal protein CcmA (bactofilin family)
MGFFENWLGDKVGAAFGRTTGFLQPAPAGAAAVPLSTADSVASVLRARMGLREPVQPTHNGPRDYTVKPNIDPEELKKILPRDGSCELTVSGLDGVLTVGKDMVMTTDQPIHCQTLRVLGTLEATVHAQRLIVAEGASVIGSIRVTDADIHGEFDGSLQARGMATISASARVSGKVRALELLIAKEAKVAGADIKRVVPRVFDDLSPDAVQGRYEEGYSSMCITVSQRSALRR